MYYQKRDFRKFDQEFFDFAKLIDFHSIEKIDNVHRTPEILEPRVENFVDQFAPFKTQRLMPKK